MHDWTYLEKGFMATSTKTTVLLVCLRFAICWDPESNIQGIGGWDNPQKSPKKQSYEICTWQYWEGQSIFEIQRSLLCLFTQIVISISATFSVSDSLLYTWSNSFSCHNVFILLSLSGVIALSLIVGVGAACVLACKFLQMRWCLTMMVVIIPS